MITLQRPYGVLLLILPFVAFAGGAGCSTSFSISNVQIPAPLPGQKNAAIYMTIQNGTSENRTLMGAECEDAAQVEIHETIMDGSVASMRRIDRLPIAAQSSVQMGPGRIHLMVINLKRELKEGDLLELNLRFDNGIQKIYAPVVAPNDVFTLSGE